MWKLVKYAFYFGAIEMLPGSIQVESGFVPFFFSLALYKIDYIFPLGELAFLFMEDLFYHFFNFHISHSFTTFLPGKYYLNVSALEYVLVIYIYFIHYGNFKNLVRRLLGYAFQFYFPVYLLNFYMQKLFLVPYVVFMFYVSFHESS